MKKLIITALLASTFILPVEGSGKTKNVELSGIKLSVPIDNLVTETSSTQLKDTLCYSSKAGSIALDFSQEAQAHLKISKEYLPSSKDFPVLLSDSCTEDAKQLKGIKKTIAQYNRKAQLVDEKNNVYLYEIHRNTWYLVKHGSKNDESIKSVVGTCSKLESTVMCSTRLKNKLDLHFHTKTNNIKDVYALSSFYSSLIEKMAR
ncbi:hypothetical protein [Pleionea sp. CnH1-48]|uniref:hypothetical protein n=1 Tax=Pleionea sp. CnH1-48 TaxID=2954494 RepID=UPI002096A598|nr:hypothetical protein [Pleionea sp. CnH1-48]MCO7224359.1 hypothetical protein [Pleionea sp. CnH1-48]